MVSARLLAASSRHDPPSVGDTLSRLSISLGGLSIWQQRRARRCIIWTGCGWLLRKSKAGRHCDRRDVPRYLWYCRCPGARCSRLVAPRLVELERRFEVVHSFFDIGVPTRRWIPIALVVELLDVGYLAGILFKVVVLEEEDAADVASKTVHCLLVSIAGGPREFDAVLEAEPEQ